MDKIIAQNILEFGEKEINDTGCSSIATLHMIKEELSKIGKDYMEYFYMEDDKKMIFNTRRWKRRFLED